MGCGIQTGAGTILNILKPKKAEPVVVLGLGGVGLTALMAAHYLGVETVIGVDIVEEKLDLAKELGATHIINSKKEPDFVSAIKKITGEGAHYAVECVGNLKILEACFELIRPGGTVMSVGLPPPGGKLTVDALAMVILNKTYKGALLGDSTPRVVSQLMTYHSACLLKNHRRFLRSLICISRDDSPSTSSQRYIRSIRWSRLSMT